MNASDCLHRLPLLALLLCGCGDGSLAPHRDPADSLLPTGGEIERDLESDRAMAMVSIDKIDGQLVYRIHEDRTSQSEVMRLAANLAAYSPDLPFILVPGPGVSQDEIAWLQAKLREKGLTNIRTVLPGTTPPDEIKPR